MLITLHLYDENNEIIKTIEAARISWKVQEVALDVWQRLIFEAQSMQKELQESNDNTDEQLKVGIAYLQSLPTTINEMIEVICMAFGHKVTSDEIKEGCTHNEITSTFQMIVNQAELTKNAFGGSVHRQTSRKTKSERTA